jgi:hypothetical protein
MSDWLVQGGSEWLRVARFGRIDRSHSPRSPRFFSDAILGPSRPSNCGRYWSICSGNALCSFAWAFFWTEQLQDRRVTRRWHIPRRHLSPASSVPGHRSVTCRHAASRARCQSTPLLRAERCGCSRRLREPFQPPPWHQPHDRNCVRIRARYHLRAFSSTWPSAGSSSARP